MKRARQKLDVHKLTCLGIIMNDVNLIEQDGSCVLQYCHYAKQG